MTRFLKCIPNHPTVSKLWSAMTWNGISIFAAIPPALLFVMPLIASVSIAFTPTNTYIMSLRHVQNILPVFALTALFCTIGKQTGEKYPLKRIVSDRRSQLWFLAFSAWLLLSTAVNGFTQAARIGDEYRLESVWTFISYGLLYYTCGTAVRTEHVKKWLYRILIAGSTLVAAAALLDFYDIIAFAPFRGGRGTEGTLFAIFHQYNHYAYFLLFSILMSAGLAVYEKHKAARLFACISLFVNTVTLTVNTTRGVILACIAALAAFYIILRLTDRTQSNRLRLAVAIFLAGSITGILLNPHVLGRFWNMLLDLFGIAEEETRLNAGSGRGVLWKTTLEAISEKPLLGWGTEGISDRLLATRYNNDRPHNEYLQYAAFYGIPALILYLGANISVFRKAYRQRMKLRPMTVIALVAASGYLISAFFGNTMYYTAPYFFVVLGFAFQSELPEKQ